MQALTGLSKTACDAAIKFAETGVLETGNKGVGRGKKKQGLNQNITKELRTIVDDANKRGIPTSAARLENELREKGIQVSARTITRYLRAEGYHWGKGTRQHVNHDAPGNVRYRQWYLQQRLANLTEIDGQIVPRHPEVFLDESYCHLNHTSAQRWVGSDGIITDQGRQPIVVMFAAFVVYYDNQARQVQGKFVKDSVHIWPSIGKAHVKKTDADAASVWNNVPDEIREASVMATDNDYHGNFNSALFDIIFTRLCQKLVEMGLTGCHIHLDGAKYHFHDTNKKPTTSNNKDEIKQWLQVNGYGMPVASKGPDHEPLKAELLAHVKNIDHPPSYTIKKIAEENGSHIIFKTPPYHCELQPIEMIWGIIKNMVAFNSQGKTTAADLKKMLDRYFIRITRDMFISVWIKTIKTGLRYTVSSDQPPDPVFVAQDDQANAGINAAAGHDVELTPSWEDLGAFEILNDYPFEAVVNNVAAGHGVELSPSWEVLNPFEILNELPYAFDADNNIQWVLNDEMVPLFQMSEGSE